MEVGFSRQPSAVSKDGFTSGFFTDLRRRILPSIPRTADLGAVCRQSTPWLAGKTLRKFGVTPRS